MCGERGREREKRREEEREDLRGVRGGRVGNKEDEAAEGKFVNDAALLRNVSVYATGVQHGGCDGLSGEIRCTVAEPDVCSQFSRRHTEPAASITLFSI